jgi:hypothetical protein
MTITLLLPAIVAIVGALVYLVAGNPKLAEIGRIMFAAGMIAICFVQYGDVVARAAIHERR